MAKEIGTNRTYYSHIENGTRELSIINLIKICDTFDITLKYLVSSPKDNYNKLANMTSKEKMNHLTYFNYHILQKNIAKLFMNLQ